MTWPPIITRIVRSLLRRMRSIREAMATSHPAPTQAVAKKRKGAEVTSHRLLMAEVFAATGKTFPAVEKKFS
jgi:hypothetical protein